MKTALILGLVYVAAMPVVLRLLAFAHKKLLIDRKAAKLKNNKSAAKNLPKPKWPLWAERLSFTFKDKRDVIIKKPKKGSNEPPKTLSIQNRQMFFILWGVGLIAVMLGVFIGLWQLMLGGFLFFFVAIIFGVKSADSIIVTRQNVYARMFSIARLKLGQSSEYEANPQAVVRVLEWNDYVKPTKVEFDVPDSFGAEGEEGFLRQYNQIFGTETTWVPSDDPEAGTPGWNYSEGKLTIHAVPPLPLMAPWDDHYVLADGVAWSFFPIALGVENGVELPNPETGQNENVLGFDLSGEQIGYGKKFGLNVSPTVTTSPQVFIGGGTGGGKALSVDTLVRVIREADTSTE